MATSWRRFAIVRSGSSFKPLISSPLHQFAECRAAARFTPESNRRNARNAPRPALAAVGLGDRLAHKPNELSGGQRQRGRDRPRSGQQPSIILADEPTGNLDSKTGEEIMSLFETLYQRREHRHSGHSRGRYRPTRARGRFSCAMAWLRVMKPRRLVARETVEV